VGLIKSELDKLSTRKEKLYNNSDLQKLIKDFETRENFEIIKKAYKEGKIKLNIYNETINKISGEKTKYADAIVNDSKDRILFLKRDSNSDFEPLKYGLPGVHVDLGESFEAAVQRELNEETNFTSTDCKEVATYEDKRSLIKYFECKFEENNNPFQEPYEIIIHSNEHENYCWMSKEQWLKEDLICNLKDVLIELYNEGKKDENTNTIQSLSKSFEDDIKVLYKATKPAVVKFKLKILFLFL
jgi:8-oxo-dGTP diphosphatase